MQQSRQWPRLLINFAGRVFTWLTFGVFFRVERRGWQNLPRTGGVMIISNHISWFDPVLLNLVLRGSRTGSSPTPASFQLTATSRAASR
jgi:1-acyl-sn-glycerol-3-phosphate acyltransferase